MTHQIASDWTNADLDQTDRALCRFAQRLTGDPTGMDETHILELKKAGLGDAAIHDATVGEK